MPVMGAVDHAKLGLGLVRMSASPKDINLYISLHFGSTQGQGLSSLFSNAWKSIFK